jgi:hypothetical protein
VWVAEGRELFLARAIEGDRGAAADRVGEQLPALVRIGEEGAEVEVAVVVEPPLPRRKTLPGRAGKAPKGISPPL